ncbi:MAG: hypothetical protein KatS3mg105_4072 [Gemmatales bacterium]|nr:MAG: hypothetical protein KatS3mg105_4072 [Gemmatales bacterium]
MLTALGWQNGLRVRSEMEWTHKPGSRQTPGWSCSERMWSGLIVIAALVGAGLRCFHYFADPSVWHDEAALILNVIDKGWLDLLGPLYFAEAAPPLFLWLEHAVYLVLGDGTYMLRLLPFLASVGSLLLMVRLARHLLSPRGAFFAVLLFAFSDRLLWHSCEAKPYALDVFFAVLLPLLFVETLHWRISRQIYLFALLAPLTIFTIYPGCFLMGGAALALGRRLWEAHEDGKRSWRAFALLGISIVVSFALLYVGPVQAQRCDAMDSCWVRTFPDWGRPWSWPGWALLSSIHVVDYCFRPVGGAWIVLAVVGMSRWRRDAAIWWLFLTPIGLAMVAGLLHAYPYTGARVMVFALPALALFIAVGTEVVLTWLDARLSQSVPSTKLARMATAFLVVWLAVPVGWSFYRVVKPWRRADCASAARFILAERRPQDFVIGSSWESQYYFRRLSESIAETKEPPPDRRVWYLYSAEMPKRELLQSALRSVPEDRRVLATRFFEHIVVLLLDRAERR